MSQDVRFTTNLVGTGAHDDPYRPEVFDSLPGGYYHLEEVDYENGEATLVLRAGRSPDGVVESVSSGEGPVKSVLGGS